MEGWIVDHDESPVFGLNKSEPQRLRQRNSSKELTVARSPALSPFSSKHAEPSSPSVQRRLDSTGTLATAPSNYTPTHSRHQSINKTVRPHLMAADMDNGTVILPSKHAVHVISAAAVATSPPITNAKMYPSLNRTVAVTEAPEHKSDDSFVAIVTGVHASPSKLTYQQQLQQHQQERLRSQVRPNHAASQSALASPPNPTPSRQSQYGRRGSAAGPTQSPVAVRPSRLSQRLQGDITFDDTTAPALASSFSSPALSTLSPAVLNASRERSVFANAAAADLASFSSSSTLSALVSPDANGKASRGGKKRKETLLEKTVGTAISNASQPYPSPAQRRQAALASQLEAVMRSQGMSIAQHAVKSPPPASFSSLLPSPTSNTIGASVHSTLSPSIQSPLQSPSLQSPTFHSPGTMQSPLGDGSPQMSPTKNSPTMFTFSPLASPVASTLAMQASATSVASFAAGTLSPSAQHLSHLLSPQRLNTPLLILKTTMHPQPSPVFVPEIVPAAVAAAEEGKSTMPLPVCEVVLDPGSPIPVGSPSHVHSQPAAAMPNSSFVVDPSGAAFATTVKPLPPLATTGLVSNAGATAVAAAAITATSHTHISMAALTSPHRSSLAAALLSNQPIHDAASLRAAVLGAAANAAASLSWNASPTNQASSTVSGIASSTQAPVAEATGESRSLVDQSLNQLASPTAGFKSPKAAAQAAKAAALSSPLKSPQAHHLHGTKPHKKERQSHATGPAPIQPTPSALSQVAPRPAPDATAVPSVPEAAPSLVSPSKAREPLSPSSLFSLQIVDKVEVQPRPAYVSPNAMRAADAAFPNTANAHKMAQMLLAAAANAAAAVTNSDRGQRAEAEAAAAAAVAAVFAMRKPSKEERESMQALLTQWSSLDVNVAAKLANPAAANEPEHAVQSVQPTASSPAPVVHVPSAPAIQPEADIGVDESEVGSVASPRHSIDDQSVSASPPPALSSALPADTTPKQASPQSIQAAQRAAHLARVEKARERQRLWAEQQAALQQSAASGQPRYLEYTKAINYQAEQAERAEARSQLQMAQRQAQPRIASFHLPESTAKAVIGASGFAVVSSPAPALPNAAADAISESVERTADQSAVQNNQSQNKRRGPAQLETPQKHNVLLGSTPLTGTSPLGTAPLRSNTASFILLPPTREDGMPAIESGFGSPIVTVPPTAAPHAQRQLAHTQAPLEHGLVLVGSLAPSIESKQRQVGGGGGGPSRLAGAGEVAVELNLREREAADSQSALMHVQQQLLEQSDATMQRLQHAVDAPKTPTLLLSLDAPASPLAFARRHEPVISPHHAPQMDLNKSEQHPQRGRDDLQVVASPVVASSSPGRASVLQTLASHQLRPSALQSEAATTAQAVNVEPSPEANIPSFAPLFVPSLIGIDASRAETADTVGTRLPTRQED